MATQGTVTKKAAPAETGAGFTRLQKTLPLVGLSFWQAWWMLLSTTPFMCGPVQYIGSTIGLLLVTTLLGYALFAFLAKKHPSYSSKRSFVAAGAACLVGSLTLSWATHFSLPFALGISLELAGSLLVSCGNALLLLMWGERWSTLTAGDVGSQLCTSFAFAFVLYFAVLYLPLALAIALNALLAPLSVLALAVSQQLPSRTETIAPVTLKLKPAVLALVAILVFSFAFGGMQRIAYASSDRASMQQLAMVVAGCCMALFALLMTLRHKSNDPYAFYRPVVPGVTCGILVCLMAPGDAVIIGNGILVASIYCLDMFMMFAASDLAYRTKLPVALVFGTAIATARAGTAAGSQFGTWIAGLPSSDTGDAAATVVLLIACAVIIAGTVVFNESSLRSIYQPDAKPHIPNLDERCAQVGATCGLSARELEVMGLLARGRSIAVISEALGIAQGTVKHHASNTYRKLGVYDRQGLIDIVAGDAETGTSNTETATRASS